MWTCEFTYPSNFKKALVLAAMTCLFGLSLHAQTETVIHSFTNGDGASPYGLTPDGKGNFFGVAALGGDFNGRCAFTGCGNVFELSPNSSGGWTESVLYTFQGGGDGAVPEALLTIDANGNLYGTTVDGGYFGNSSCGLVVGGCGVVYKLSPNADGSFSQSVLYRFRGGKDGFLPQTQVIPDGNGNLFGTADLGGSHSVGNIFQLSPNGTGGWSFKVLYDFNNGMDGGRPVGFAMDSKGNLFASTSQAGITAGPCGSTGCGTILELSPNGSGGWTRKMAHAFTGKKDGAIPLGLIFDANGNLFGAALFGGHTNCVIGPIVGCGVIFELTPLDGHWQEHTLYEFTGGSDGATPRAAPTFDADGNAFGTSNDPAGACPGNCGAVYELSPGLSGWTESTLYVFSGSTDGGIPDTNGVVLDHSGDLLGTTELGGIAADCTLGPLSGCGVIYEINR